MKEPDSTDSKTSHSESSTLIVQETIGGWLRCFQVLIYISLILCISAFLIMIGTYVMGIEVFENPYDRLHTIAELTPLMIIDYLIIKTISKAEPGSPDRIVLLLGISFGISCLVAILSKVAHNYGLISEAANSMLGALIFYFIWTFYFKKSKRVLAFYGKNAD